MPLLCRYATRLRRQALRFRPLALAQGKAGLDPLAHQHKRCCPGAGSLELRVQVAARHAAVVDRRLRLAVQRQQLAARRLKKHEPRRLARQRGWLAAANHVALRDVRKRPAAYAGRAGYADAVVGQRLGAYGQQRYQNDASGCHARILLYQY